jgi:hypothetical protein
MHTFLLLALTAFAAPSEPGPTLAVEDTMYTSVPEVLVRAPRVTLDEILDRVAQGEARRDSMIHDQAFTFTMRVVGNVAGSKDPRLLVENVRRVYRKRPDHVRAVMLRDYRYKEKGDAVRAEFSSNMSEEIVNFAFRPEARREYRYSIANRSLVGDHVIYEIEFEPRSRLAFDKPRGRVWVDTNDFVIIREELSFDRSPAPLILRGVDRAVVEREKIDGHWVLRRALVRMSLTVPMPTVGRRFDMTLMYDDYALNQGIDDALFDEPARTEAR